MLNWVTLKGMLVSQCSVIGIKWIRSKNNSFRGPFPFTLCAMLAFEKLIHARIKNIRRKKTDIPLLEKWKVPNIQFTISGDLKFSLYDEI